MLSLVTQDGKRKLEIKNYSILDDKLRAFIITDGGVILGEYKSLKTAKDVFYEMVKVEEKQALFLSRKEKDEALDKGHISSFFIYEMPLDESDDDNDEKCFEEAKVEFVETKKKIGLFTKVFSNLQKMKKNI